MAAPKAPLLDAAGTKAKDVTLEESIFGAEVKPHLVHETVRAELNADRAGTRGAKSRGLVAGGRAKPWRQKGTGRARAGTTRAPQFTGGGVAFPPGMRNFEVKVNKKVRHAALRSALSDHAANGSIAVVGADAFGEPSTPCRVSSRYRRSSGPDRCWSPRPLSTQCRGGPPDVAAPERSLACACRLGEELQPDRRGQVRLPYPSGCAPDPGAHPDGYGRRTCPRRSGCSSSPRRQAQARLRSGAATSGGPPLHCVESGLGDQHRSGPDDLRYLELTRHGDDGLRKVPEGLDQRLVVRRGDHEQRQLLPPRSEQAHCLLRRRFAECVRADDSDRAVRGVIGESRAQGCVTHLLVHLHLEVAHARREGDATARELRCARRARAGATSALLAPRLRAAAGDEPARLRAASAGAIRIQFGADRLVNEVRPHVGAEHALLERHVLRLLAGGVEQGSFHRRRLDGAGPRATCWLCRHGSGIIRGHVTGPL